MTIDHPTRRRFNGTLIAGSAALIAAPGVRAQAAWPSKPIRMIVPYTPGGFNIYPSDLEAVLREHPAVADVAVVGVPSVQWGETPVAFVVRRAGDTTEADALKQWLNQRVGKTQRLADLRLVDELPRSAIGKVLKRELRDLYTTTGDTP